VWWWWPRSVGTAAAVVSSAAPAVHPAPPALDRRRLEAPASVAETDSIEQAITLLETHRTESIMSLQTTLFTAAAAVALAVSAVATQAAPQNVVKLERVVITGKATREVVQLPRVVVTGYAQRDVAQLPRVVIQGYSEATLLRQATLAAAKTAATTKRI
jgi:hypothetical protein